MISFNSLNIEINSSDESITYPISSPQNSPTHLKPLKLDSLCCKLSIFSYKDPQTIQEYINQDTELQDFSQYKFYNSSLDAQAFTIYSKLHNILFVVFRGTESSNDVLANMQFIPKNFELPFQINGCNPSIHSGFANQFSSLKNELTNTINHFILNNYITNTIFDNRPKHIIFTGYSLGGALSTIASCYYATKFANNKQVIVHNYNFGCPRVGNFDFCILYRSTVKTIHRYVNEGDPVCALPFEGYFQHPTNMIYLNNNKKIIFNKSSNNTNCIDIFYNGLKYLFCCGCCDSKCCISIKKKCNINADPYKQFKYHNSDYYYEKLIKNGL